MALPTVIAKNQTGTPIFLPRLGLTAPASPGTIILTDFATFYEVSAEEVLHTRVSAGDIVINDGTNDLSTAEALGYLDATGNMNGPVDTPAANKLVKLADSSGRYTLATGILVDASNNVTGITILTATTLNGTNIQVGGSPIAWNDLNDVTLTTVAQGDVAYFNGTNWVNLPAGSPGDVFSSGGGGANPAWAAPGGGATLQSAYDGGNTIVTASTTPISFTLTSGGFTVDGAGAVNIGATAATQTLNFGTGAAVKTVTVGSTNGASPLTLQAGTGAINIGASASARTINVGTGAAIQTINVGGTAANVLGIGNTQTAGSISLGAAMTTGTINVGGTGLQTGAINVGVGTGAQTINFGTGATGAKTVVVGSTAAASVTTINSGTGAINIGPTIAKTITVGNTTGATTVNLTSGTGNVNTTTAMAWNGVISPTSLAVSQNDYNPTNLAAASLVRQATSADVTITGLAGGANGRIIVLTNISANIITLTNEDALSTAANRFLFGDFIRLFPEDSVILQYDGTSSRWRAPATSRGTVAGEVKVAFTQFGSNAATSLGEHNTVTVGSNGSINLEARIPDDFNALVSLAAVMFPGSTNATANIDLTSTYCSLGEVFNNHSETDTTITYNLTASVLTRIQANTVATAITAGDFIGVEFKHNTTGGTSNYLGMVLVYT